MDTYNDDEMSDYGDSDGGAGRKGFGELDDDDKLDVNFDDLPDEDDDDEAINLDAQPKGGSSSASAAKEESKESATADETNNTSSDGEQAQGSNQSTGGSSGSGGNGSTGNLFAVGESKDKGLADMETGSEVYMSELLVSETKTLTRFDV